VAIFFNTICQQKCQISMFNLLMLAPQFSPKMLKDLKGLCFCRKVLVAQRQLSESVSWKGKLCSICERSAWWKSTQTQKMRAFESINTYKSWKGKGRPNCSFTKHVASHHSGILSMCSLWRWDGKILYSKSFTNVRITMSWHTFYCLLPCWFLLS